MARARTPPSSSGLLEVALGELAGAALVLDEQLRIVAATPAAEALLGDVPRGTSAPALLCGDAVERPVAEALAAGRPVTATVPRLLGSGAEVWVVVRTVPLGAAEGGRPNGWILLVDLERSEAAGLDAPVELHGMWTRDPAMKRLFSLVLKVARTDASVLVRGETGAGKELVAHALHASSTRREGPFRALNCAALPPALLESELFGHVRGAFTGAVRDHLGHFRQAGGGTLFLDEIAELPLELQAKLLRVIETHTVLPVGAGEPVPVDVRVVAATHRSLRAEVQAGRFRADLMYRLRVVPLFLPPLRARPGDVTLLADRTVADLNQRGGRYIERIAPGALARLKRHDWPGNVRELRNALEYAYAVGEGPVLVEADLPPEIGDEGIPLDEPGPVANRPPALPGESDSPEAARLRRALERAHGHKGRAARMLGISRSTLWRRLRALGIA